MNAKNLGSPCPTCGAPVGEQCELHSGMFRDQTHRDRPAAHRDLESDPKTLFKTVSVERNTKMSPVNSKTKIPPMILVLSKATDLADIRARILQEAGYRVESAMDLNSFRTMGQGYPKVDLVIVGYSLPVQEKRRVTNCPFTNITGNRIS